MKQWDRSAEFALKFLCSSVESRLSGRILSDAIMIIIIIIFMHSI
jgi:hypothetical protein